MYRRARGVREWFVLAFMLLGLAAAAGVAPSVAVGGTIRDDRDPQLYLNLGAAPQYASVGRFDLTKDMPGYSASGTLIDDNWVLTAAHALDGATAGQFTVGGRSYGISKWITHPKWDGELRRGFDLALVKLDGTVTDVAPAQLYTGHRELGAVGTFVGFGRTGTGTTGDTIYDGLKRAGQNTIDGTIGREEWPKPATFRNKLPGSARTFVVDFDSPTDPAKNVVGSATPVNVEYLISLGDSGGGDFIDLGKGPVLAGVNSFAEVPDGVDDSGYGDVTGHVRVSAHAKWIRTTLKKEARAEAASLRRELRLARGNGRLLTPDEAASPGAVSIVPEPGSAGLALLAFAALFLRRRRD
jgi:MYXO-CTERM domain-containing protein